MPDTTDDDVAFARCRLKLAVPPHRLAVVHAIGRFRSGCAARGAQNARCKLELIAAILRVAPVQAVGQFRSECTARGAQNAVGS